MKAAEHLRWRNSRQADGPLSAAFPLGSNLIRREVAALPAQLAAPTCDTRIQMPGKPNRTIGIAKRHPVATRQALAEVIT